MLEQNKNVDKVTLDALKQNLINIRSELLDGVHKLQEQSSTEFSGELPDLNDEASRTYGRQVLLSLGEVDRQQLKLVDEALLRMESGEYGTCIDCEEDIPLGRLQAAPYVKRCVMCKEKWEEESRAES